MYNPLQIVSKCRHERPGGALSSNEYRVCVSCVDALRHVGVTSFAREMRDAPPEFSLSRGARTVGLSSNWVSPGRILSSGRTMRGSIRFRLRGARSDAVLEPLTSH